MIQMLLNAPPGTVSPVLSVRSVCHGVFDMQYFVTGTGSVEIWVSGSATLNDFIHVVDLAAGTFEAVESIITEGPFERMKIIAKNNNAGNISCFLQPSL